MYGVYVCVSVCVSYTGSLSHEQCANFWTVCECHDANSGRILNYVIRYEHIASKIAAYIGAKCLGQTLPMDGVY